MTKKMLAVALMLSSVAVLAGCNKTPAENEVIMTGDEVVIEEITPVEEVEAVEEDAEVEALPEEVAPVEEAAVAVEPEVEIVAAE